MAESTTVAPPAGVELGLTGITRRFGTFTAVDGIDLLVRPGEFMTLLGPSGSGKTTTLNMIAGFLQPDRGTIDFDGRDVSRIPANRRNIGMVFQNYALFPTMSVRDNVGYPLRQRRIRGAARRTEVDAALAMVELEQLAERRPAELSGGQQQRVALARALVHRPPLLLMDEPLGALDRRLRDSLQTEIARIHRQIGTTVIYVTHDQDEALCLSDRIAVFRNGRIDQVGTPDDVYERPRTSFVAGFVGDSNVFDGPVTGRNSITLACGREVRATSSPSGTGSATMIVRPERMRVIDADGTAPIAGANVLEATVAAERYLGATRLVTLERTGGRPLLVRENAWVDPARPRGARVQVCWSPDDGVWVDDHQPADAAAA
ncbi:ABC transporter ATP-binding protein [Microlunatus sp. GCM10028923]|uniref:ABC transporter ATP-binding protein n=1 Tax=Microlunatus sp. GCM10028923 TaxID=3273400 RepID=UPI003605BCD1